MASCSGCTCVHCPPVAHKPSRGWRSIRSVYCPTFLVGFAVATTLLLIPTSLPVTATARSFGQDGDVWIAGLFPIFNRDATDQCTGFRLFFNIAFVQPFLFLLRRRNFSVKAYTDVSHLSIDDDSSTPPVDHQTGNCTGSVCFNETVRELKVGFLVADTCKGLLEPVQLSLIAGHHSPGRYDGTDCPSGQPSPENLARQKIVAMIGPVTSVQLTVSAPVLSSFNVVQVSPTATSDSFACHLTSTGRCSPEHEYLFRTVATDRAQAGVIHDILRKLNWTHVALVYASDQLLLANSFLQETNTSTSCLAFDMGFTADDRIEDVIFELNKPKQTVNVVVLLALDETAEILFHKLATFCEKSNHTAIACRPRVWLGNDGWWVLAHHVLKDMRYYSAGIATVITIGLTVPLQFTSTTSRLQQEFSDYLHSLTAETLRTVESPDPWLCQEMEGLNGCSGVCKPTAWNTTTPNACPNMQTLPRLLFGEVPLSDAGNKNVLLATEAVLTALENIFQEFVDSNTDLSPRQLSERFPQYAHGEKLLLATQNVSLPCDEQFSESGRCLVFPPGRHEMQPAYIIRATSSPKRKVVDVGEWYLSSVTSSDDHAHLKINVSKIAWPQHSSIMYTSEGVPRADCTPECSPGQEKRRIESTCCYQCENCSNNSISIRGESCKRCPLGQEARDGVECVRLPVKELSFTWKVLLLVLIVTSMMMIILTMVVYAKKRFTAIVRADTILTWTLLASMLTALLASSLHLLSPTMVVCTTQSLLAVPALLVSLAVLCVKTGRIARLGIRSARLGKFTKRWSMQTSAQLLFITGITAVGTIAEVVRAVISPFQPKVIPGLESNFIVCSSSSQLGAAVDFYGIFIILVTTALAFITRKLPMNFNEARLLFLGGFSLVVLWITSGIQYYLAQTEDRVIIECIHLISHVIIIWVWLFSPRLYIIIMRPKKNTSRLPNSMKLSIQSETYLISLSRSV